ncbi:hypothetical protein C1H46_031346 [Malus baccata]|uniref:Uncharacterized protein n=1 Tax=Malus baccata TaxID=106549 RepID=A0A540L9G3_MALBA|nr:hypothetical protein C1H46_031346 [Malus baccata]
MTTQLYHGRLIELLKGPGEEAPRPNLSPTFRFPFAPSISVSSPFVSVPPSQTTSPPPLTQPRCALPSSYRGVSRLYWKVSRALARVFAPPPSSSLSFLVLSLMGCVFPSGSLVLWEWILWCCLQGAGVMVSFITRVLIGWFAGQQVMVALEISGDGGDRTVLGCSSFLCVCSVLQRWLSHLKRGCFGR